MPITKSRNGSAPTSSVAADLRCAARLRADVTGALYWPAEDALIIADLHLEKGSAMAARGQLLPPYDTRETLHRLAEALDRYDAQTVIALGDSLHDVAAAERMIAKGPRDPAHPAGGRDGSGSTATTTPRSPTRSAATSPATSPSAV